MSALASPLLPLILDASDQMPWQALFLSFCAASVLLNAVDLTIAREARLNLPTVIEVVAVVVLGVVPGVLVSAISSSIVVLAYRATHRRGPSLWANLTRVGALVAAGLVGATVAALEPSVAVPDVMVAGACIFAALGLEHLSGHVLVARRQGRSPIIAFTGGRISGGETFLAQLSTGLLTVLIFPTMGPWSILMAVALQLLTRQSLALLERVKRTYLTTVSVLVEAAEASDSVGVGHAERTAAIAREIAAFSGLRSIDVERVEYAALLHDVAEIGADRRGSATRPRAWSIVEGIPFFADISTIMRLCDGEAARQIGSVHDTELTCAFIVALASDIDDINTAGGHSPSAGAVVRLSETVPTAAKARVVSSALRLGLRIPAVP